MRTARWRWHRREGPEDPKSNRRRGELSVVIQTCPPSDHLQIWIILSNSYYQQHKSKRVPYHQDCAVERIWKFPQIGHYHPGPALPN